MPSKRKYPKKIYKTDTITEQISFWEKAIKRSSYPLMIREYEKKIENLQKLLPEKLAA